MGPNRYQRRGERPAHAALPRRGGGCANAKAAVWMGDNDKNSKGNAAMLDRPDPPPEESHREITEAWLAAFRTALGKAVRGGIVLAVRDRVPLAQFVRHLLAFCDVQRPPAVVGDWWRVGGAGARFSHRHGAG